MRLTPAASAWCALLALGAGLGMAGIPSAGPPDYEAERAAMVDRLRAQGIRDERVLAAMGRVPRHVFVPLARRAQAYEDIEISVGFGRVLHRPHDVALASQLLELRPGEKVLQVGAGCGYCTAVLSEITPEVYVMDMSQQSIRLARAPVRDLGYSSVRWRRGKACRGWPEQSPYDAILVLCAAEQVPDTLVSELRDGGRMVVPIGSGPEQTLTCVRKTAGTLRAEVVTTIRVPAMQCQGQRTGATARQPAGRCP